MEAKPPGWAAEYAAWFDDESVAAHYPLRPPYRPETIDVLVRLLDPATSAVLDAGCGPGDLARPLAGRVARVDALDRASAMLAVGRGQHGGRAPNLRWVHGTVESAGLTGPYGLIVCGDSIHWFDWSTALPRFEDTLTRPGIPGGRPAPMAGRSGCTPAPEPDLRTRRRQPGLPALGPRTGARAEAAVRAARGPHHQRRRVATDS
ncbi:MAG: class I SAM-dependent methyltransferase [Nocardioides sp.]|nr:class I SAM-dependent methyltransferase [Nocardioides sp.]